MSAYTLDMSVMMPIRITSPEIWAWALPPNRADRAKVQADALFVSFMVRLRDKEGEWAALGKVRSAGV